MTVTPITACKNIGCQQPIHVRDVYKEKDVRTAPGHVVLMYQCPKCDLVGRIVGENEVWHDRQREAAFEDHNIDGIVEAFADDLEVLVEHVGDLKTIWASHATPPILEDRRGKCRCKDCRRRYESGA